MNIIPIDYWYNRKDVYDDWEYMYIFTDNLNRTSGNIPIIRYTHYTKKYGENRALYHGNSTQAVIRGLDNAYPISTMLTEKRDQFSDKNYNLFCINLDDEIKHIIKDYKELRFKGIKYNNEMPFGDANISKMKTSAPKCWSYLNEKLLEINIKNN